MTILGGPRTLGEVALSLDTSAYSVGDVLSNTVELANVFRRSGIGGIVTSVTVIDADDQGQSLDLVFLDSNVSLGTRNAAPTISDADALSIIGQIHINTGHYIDMGGVQVAYSPNLFVPVAVATGTSLYLSAISRGVGTYTSTGLTVRLGIDFY